MAGKAGAASAAASEAAEEDRERARGTRVTQGHDAPRGGRGCWGCQRAGGRAGAGRARAAVQEPTESALPSFELPGLLCQLMHSAVLI